MEKFPLTSALIQAPKQWKFLLEKVMLNLMSRSDSNVHNYILPANSPPVFSVNMYSVWELGKECIFSVCILNQIWFYSACSLHNWLSMNICISQVLFAQMFGRISFLHVIYLICGGTFPWFLSPGYLDAEYLFIWMLSPMKLWHPWHTFKNTTGDNS